MRDRITKSKGVWDKDPVRDAVVILDFYLKPERFRGNKGRPGNDLDNLAKLVLDSLCIKVNGWRGYGVLYDDTDVLDLLLRKRASTDEGIRIRLYQWRAELIEELFSNRYHIIEENCF